MPLLLLNKPYRVLCQFSDAAGRATLADYISDRAVYPAGRLDYDSEGLLALTADGRLQAAITRPASKLRKTYWVQVEGLVTPSHAEQLMQGVKLRDGPARALHACPMSEPQDLWPRNPPIRQRKSIPTSWLRLCIYEGRNRQVRRMTAAVGLPTLRLIRSAVGPWQLDGLRPGESRAVPTAAAWRSLRERT